MTHIYDDPDQYWFNIEALILDDVCPMPPEEPNAAE